MKKLWKKGLLLALAWALAFGVCGCDKKTREEPTEPAAETVMPSAAVTPTGEDPTEPATATPIAEEQKSFLACCQAALTRLLEKHVGPDGYAWGDVELTSQDISENEFAVADVDMDGELELIVRWTTTIVAGYRTMVYGYDEERGELVEKLWGTEACRFYNNAIAQIYSSHNQGPGGRFWPYNVSEYDAQMGKYNDIASVRAWDFKLVPNPEYQKNVGAEVDEFIYYIHDLGNDTGEETIMTQTEYDAWYDSIFGGAEEIEVAYWPLTAENIKRLCESGNT